MTTLIDADDLRESAGGSAAISDSVVVKFGGWPGKLTHYLDDFELDTPGADGYRILVLHMDESRTYQRKQYLVDRSYQLRFVRRLTFLFAIICFIAIASSLIATAILWKNMYRPELEQQTHIAAAFIGMATVLLVELLISIPITYFWGIRQSHQIVGPMKRLTQAIDAIGQGDFSQRLILREGDVLADVATAINQMAEHLQKRSPSSRGS